jgi:mono/diheme cytochrome c family protein
MQSFSRPGRRFEWRLSALVLLFVATLVGCKAASPGKIESMAANEAKRVTIGGKDWKNPSPDTPATFQTGKEHFQHHCQICHGLDGHNTGVPFAANMSPPIPDLSDKKIQDYTDGQLKWIIQNGIRFTGMPSWKGILEDDEMWAIVRYLRMLPPKGSEGVPAIYKEEQEEHEQMEHGAKPEHHHHH